MKRIQYTIRSVPPDVDRALRRKAKAASTSLNEVALRALRHEAGLADGPFKKRDLSDLAGSWVEDPEFDAAMEWFEQIHPEDWR